MRKFSKIILVATLAIIMACAILLTGCSVAVPDKYKKDWSKDTVFDRTCYQTLQIKGDQLKILQLTDIHFDDHNNRKDWTLDLLRSVIEEASPDLISVTGDWASTNIAKKREVATRTVFDVIDSYGIPWIVAFGNHDAEGELSKYDYADVFASYENSMFDVGFTNLKGGAGNYVIIVEKDGKPVQAVVTVDSHSALRKWSTDYDWIGADQIEWYKWAMAGVQDIYRQAGGDGIIPSINFQHIPVNEYKDNMDDPNCYVLGENKEEAPVCWPGKKNTGWFTALKEVGSSKGVFFGHDHANNKIIKVDGIYLGYGVESGWCKGYAEDCKKGGLLIKFGFGGNMKFEQISYPA